MTRSGPLPLRSEPELQKELLLALSDHEAELPTGAQLSTLRARLPEGTGAPATSRFGAGGELRLKPKRSKRLRVGVVLAFLLLAAVAAASYLAANRGKSEGTPRTGASASAQVGKRGPSGSANALPVLDASAPPSTPGVDASALPTPAPPKAVAEEPSELGLLHEARRLRVTDPAAALRVVARHIQLFPRGVLAQERELVAIESLVRLGRSADARARGAAFLRLYPESVHAHQVQKLIAPSASEPSAPPADAGAIDGAKLHQSVY